ncbi:MAG: hypothetical protein ABIK98_11110 [Pseudomonadota bacterium]
MMTPTPFPCDSPQVVILNNVPNVLPGMFVPFQKTLLTARLPRPCGALLKTQRAPRKDNFLLPLRGRQKKKLNRYAMFFYFKRPQDFLLIVFSPLNGKQ